MSTGSAFSNPTIHTTAVEFDHSKHGTAVLGYVGFYTR